MFFPEGIAFDGDGFVGTAVTAPAFSYLRTIEDRNERMVDLTGIVLVRRARRAMPICLSPVRSKPDRAERGMVDLTGIEPVTS